MQSRERIITALNLGQPDIVPSYEMLISPPSVIKQIIGREPIFYNYKYLYELWSKGKMIDKESVNRLNQRFTEDCYETYQKLGLDMIRFYAVGMDPTEWWRGEIRPPTSIKKVSDREWVVDGKRMLYDSLSFWNWEPTSSIVMKGPDYVRSYVKNEGRRMIEEVKNAPLDNVRHLVKLNKGKMFILTDVGSTNNIVSDTYGVSEALKWFYTHPDVIRSLYKLYADLSIETGKVAIDCGTDGVQICEDYGYKNGPWISPAHFKEFVLPNLKRMSRVFRRKGAYFVLHSDGNVKSLMNMFVDAGFHAYQSIDKIAGMDLAYVKKEIGDRICLIGNVGHDVLISKNMSDVEAEVKRCMRSAAVGGGYIISCTGAMTDSKLPNIKALIKYSRKYGKYPLKGLS
ncbi:MAG: uroporphyrinogen decarboxylase family protein [Nitrososphaeria archaeon]|jgi:uroporphyrinogen-III decarboxylase